MAKPSPPRRTRRVLLLGAGIAGLCLCGVLLLGIFSLTNFSDSAPQRPPLQPTQAAVGSIPASAPRVTSLALRTASPLPERTALPTPTVLFLLLQTDTGELHLDYPLSLVVDQDEIVQVEIVPDRPVALAGTSALAPAARLLVETSPQDAPRRSVSYAIPLYPVMSAELAAARQELSIAAGSETKQVIDPFDRNFWTWSLVARRGGEYRITLRVFGYNALTDDDPLRQVVNDTRILQVQERPLGERLTQGLADNWLLLFGAGGPLALILAILSLWFARRESQKPKG